MTDLLPKQFAYADHIEPIDDIDEIVAPRAFYEFNEDSGCTYLVGIQLGDLRLDAAQAKDCLGAHWLDQLAESAADHISDTGPSEAGESYADWKADGDRRMAGEMA